MLGRLLSTAASTFGPSHSARASAQLESVTEEEHTSGLLFPDVSLLHSSKTHAYPLQTSGSSPNASSAGRFDDRGGLDLEANRDFRVIIAQNAIGDRDDPCVLLDTQTMSHIDPSGRPPLEYQLIERTLGRHSRHSTLSRDPSRLSTYGSQSSIPDFDLAAPKKQDAVNSSAFFHVKNRRSTFSVTSSESDAQSSRLAAEANEVGLLHCMFGSSAFNYRGSSTKLHILPGGGEPPHEVDSHRSHSVRRRSPLHRSTTNWPQPASLTSVHGTPPRPSDPKIHTPTKIAVLVTRMFSVNLPEPREISSDQPEQPVSSGAESLHENEFPFLEASKRKKLKEKKTPMFAVALIIQLPLSTRGRPWTQYPIPGDGSKHPAYLSVSLDSSQRISGSFFNEHFGSKSATSNVDDRIDALLEHWDLINRTLSYLERRASKEILALLKQVDALSARYPKPAKPPNMQRTNQKIVQLPPGVLFGNFSLREELLRSMHRVCLALRIPRVITGQSRWGIWREEARWVARFLNDKEHNFFFLVLITAFLGNHTEWLSCLGPDWYRRRHQLQQKAQLDNELIITNRTVIISPDKMTARRLIFILSAFLPAQQRSDGVASPLRPGTATSAHPYCASPPNNAPISRQQSLRRTINKRNRTFQYNDEPERQERSASIVSTETSALPDDVDLYKSDILHGRRDSDARSIRTTGLPIPPYDARSRRGFQPTAATAAPGTATPVPHFASQRDQLRKTGLEHSLYDDNPSAASVNLLQHLQRSESAGINPASGDRQSPGTWGSIFSGFWGSRGASSSGARDGSVRRPSLIKQPESAASNWNKGAVQQDSTDIAVSNEYESSVPTTEPHSAASQGLSNTNIQDEAKHYSLESPVKLSVEANDGVVDVEVPLPGFLSLSSSGDSELTSPKKTRTSVTSIESGASIHSGLYAASKEYDGLIVNVAGWLKSYHDDFLLQAICPYPDLEVDIKRSMAAEPTPSNVIAASASSAESSSGKWVDVCTTLVADTRTFTVKRFRLRRKIPAPKPQKTVQQNEGSFASSPYSSLLTSQISNNTSSSTNYDQPGLEEELVEEPVMDLDGTLVDAVERVIARSGPPSAIHSRAASPNRHRKGKGGTSETSDSRKSEVPTVEVPRNECRRTVLGALEEVVRSVAAERRQEDPNLSRAHSRSALGTYADNTLREGIRKWLLDVEEAC
ncbi:hypothetical protein VTO42DRAFT_2047 [Malbranchea cinnamomea]